MKLNNIYKSETVLSIDYQSLRHIFRDLSGANLQDLNAIGEYLIRSDSQISSEIHKRKISVLRLPYVITCKDRSQHEFLSDFLKSTDFKRMSMELASAIYYGFASFIVQYKNVNSSIYPDYRYIDPKFFIAKKGVLGVNQGSKFIPVENDSFFTHHHPTDSGDFINRSLLYKLATIACIKNMVLNKYMTYLNSLSIPPMIIKSDIADEKDRNNMVDVAVGLKANGVALFGKDDVVELLNGNVDRGTFIEFIKYCDECISKVVTGQVLSGNSSPNGTQALGSVHDRVRKSVEEFDCSLLQASITALLNKLLSLNFQDPCPANFTYDTNTEIDESCQADVYLKLKQIGVRVPIEHLEETFNISGLTYYEGLSK